MRISSASLRLFVSIAVLITLAACSPRANQPAFYDQVRAWVPRGTTAEEATQIMQRQLFEVYESTDAQGRTYLDCTRVRFDPQRNYEIEWRAKLYLTGEASAATVSDIEANVA